MEPFKSYGASTGEKSLNYSQYLKVNEILNLQTVLSNPPEHDETLFIIIHQVYELWFKQILHEMSHCKSELKQNKPLSFLRTLRRVSVIQSILNNQVDVLETMTSVDFNRFRERLNPASGFQSYQFRLFEFQLGIKENYFLKMFEANSPQLIALQAAFDDTSIFEEFLTYLKNQRQFPLADNEIVLEKSGSRQASEKIVKALLPIYENKDQYFDLYEICEALIDCDEKLILWRHRHVVMVERMIGYKMGTGGSSGADYLRKTLSKQAFPELWAIRSHLK